MDKTKVNSKQEDNSIGEEGEENNNESNPILEEYEQLLDDIQSILDEHSDGWYNKRKDTIRELHIWYESMVRELDHYQPSLKRVINRMKKLGLDTTKGERLLWRIE